MSNTDIRKYNSSNWFARFNHRITDICSAASVIFSLFGIVSIMLMNNMGVETKVGLEFMCSVFFLLAIMSLFNVLLKIKLRHRTMFAIAILIFIEFEVCIMELIRCLTVYHDMGSYAMMVIFLAVALGGTLFSIISASNYYHYK